MQFFNCPCSGKGNVILDGVDQGPNKDAAGNLLPKQCNAGLHRIALKCLDEKQCDPAEVQVEIRGTNPIHPLEVPFQCA
jgi:hypothetical protein